jgi:uncharacterized membrane protein
MQSVIEYLKVWQPHPFVDHFTVALILLGIVTDLIASIFSARLWIRYMALSLMILGAIGAFGSNVSGGWEAGRVWDSVNGPGKKVLESHAWWGDVLPWVFAGLALWRVGIQFIGFIAATRPIYLLAAIIGGALIVYQGHLGSVMVYDYGIGTAMLAAGPASTPPAAAPVPQVTGTPAIPAPSSLLPSPPIASTSTSSPTSSMTATPAPIPTISVTPSPAQPSTIPSPAQPSAMPSASAAPLSSPPPPESPSPTSGEAKNL